MQRGNLVIYDNDGRIWYQSGEAEGDILAHEYPVGLPYIEIPFGTMKSKRLISIDTSVKPHVPVFEDIIREKTQEEVIQELENQILLLEDEKVGGIL